MIKRTFIIFCFFFYASASFGAEEKTISKEEHKIIYRELIDLIAENRNALFKIPARFGLSLQELREQIHIKSVGEKLQLMVDVFEVAEDALKAKDMPKIIRGDKDLDKKASRALQREINTLMAENYKKLENMAKKRSMKLQEFRDKLNQKEVVELFDFLIDAIEYGQDGEKIKKDPLHYKILESIPWRIKVDEADEYYYKIKPHEVKYYDALESLHRKFNALSDEEYHVRSTEYEKAKKDLKDKLKRQIGRHCDAFSQIDPYLQRRGQSCGVKCKPIEICKEIQ